MKKVMSIFLTFALVLSLSVTAFAAEPVEPTDAEKLQNIYDTAYEIATKEGNVSASSVENDYDAYACLLSNKELVVLENNEVLVDRVDSDKFNHANFQDFLSRLNGLLDAGAISIDDTFRIYVKEAPSVDYSLRENVALYTSNFDLMPLARSHAKELQKVFDDALFGTAHIVAGLYFTERVKSGGVWDYKIPLGTNTTYYEPTLKRNMTGETIGNFHYGYVGSAVFGPTTLKTAAGLVQIISGTSSLSYWNSYFDDPRDTKDIQWGIDIYNKEH